MGHDLMMDLGLKKQGTATWKGLRLIWQAALTSGGKSAVTT